MTDIYLQGSEAVGRAGHEMARAAEDMLRAASTIDESLRRHEEFLTTWLRNYDIVKNGSE